MSKRDRIDLAICTLVMCCLYLGRGFLLAQMVGGRYPIPDLVMDFVGLAVLILLLRGFEYILRRSFDKLIVEEKVWQKRALVAGRWVLVFLVAAPMLLAISQIHPQRIVSVGTPADVGYDYQSVEITSRGQKLSGWYLPAKQADRPVVVIAHGLGGNKQNFLPAAAMVRDMDFNALIFDFPAHGESDGSIMTAGDLEAEDVKAAHDWVQANYPGTPIYALGYSMGGAATLQAAGRYGIFEKIVLDNTFASAESVARSSLLWMFGPLKTPAWELGRFWVWLFSRVDMADHRPVRWIKSLEDRPLLLIHGTDDEVIPCTESIELQQASDRSAQLWLVEGLGHNQAMGHPEYRTRLHEFFIATDKDSANHRTADPSRETPSKR